MKNKLSKYLTIVALAIFFSPAFSSAYFSPGQTLNPTCSPTDAGCDISPSSTGAYSASGNGISVSAGGVFSLVLDGNSLQALASGLSLNINGLSTTSILHDGDFIPIRSTDGQTYKVTKNDLLSGVTGSLSYQGTWDASSGNPETCNVANTNHYFVSSTSGSGYNIGDWAICNGTIWQQISNSTVVSSVFGRVGAVIASSGDYTALQITNTPAGDISSPNVQGALNELDNEKESKITAGLASQYYRGDKTWQPLNKTTIGISKISDIDVPAYTGNAGKMLVVNGTADGLTWASALTTSLTSGSLFIGDSSGKAKATALSGDATINSDGLLTIAENSVALGNKSSKSY